MSNGNLNSARNNATPQHPWVKLLAMAAMALALGTGREALAAVPGTMVIDGVLTSLGGGAAADGAYNMTFSISDKEVGGNTVWTEGSVKINVKNGGFDYVLGTSKALDSATLAGLIPPWLGVTIENNPALPRVPLHSVAYSLRAAAAEALDCTGCLKSTNIGKGAVMTEAIADGAVGDAQVAFNYAGSAAKGGAASDVNCSGCIQGGEIDPKATINVASIGADTGIFGAIGATDSATVGGKAVCTEAGNCKDTLQSLSCAANQLIVWDGLAWKCSAPPASGVTLDQLGCKANEVVTYDGAKWLCKALSDKLGSLNCNAGQVPVKKADGSWGCGDIAAASTPGQACQGAYAALQWDGKVWKCVNVMATGLSGGKFNGFEVIDSWKDAWDGNQRGAMNWTNAKTTCESLGARLPTMTELWRTSAVGTGQVGSTGTTDYVWALNPRSPNNVMIQRLSDGDRTSSDVASLRPFRCIWPAVPDPKTFNSDQCNGDPGAECFTLKKVEGGRFNIDMKDRPAIPKGAALWECDFERGHMANYNTLVEAIQQQLPNGSGNWVNTADDARYNWGTLILWSNINPAFSPSTGNTDVTDNESYRNFRCSGINYASGTYPGAIANEYVARNYSKFDGKDRAALDYDKAHDVCWNAGGHLPRSCELGEVIAEGLPNGSDAWLYTSDQVGYENNSYFYVALVKWAAADPFYGHYYSKYMTHTNKTGNNPLNFRCIYYPIDTNYTGPADPANNCAGGCQTFDVPGNQGAKMWVDKFDRVQTSLGAAMSVCNSVGGRLWSERDATETIRAGLVNGSNNWVHTWDVGRGAAGSQQEMIVKWAGVDKLYHDFYNSNYMTWGGLTDLRPFRCIWTNELRY